MPSANNMAAPKGPVAILSPATMTPNSDTTLMTTQLPVQIPILLLEEEPDPLPKWMAYYARVSYILYGIHIVYSWFHLGFVTYVWQDKLLYMKFQPVYEFIEYNSYSILCPMLCMLLVGILIYHVKHKIKLDDGDFFGLLGILLFLCLLLCYDAEGVHHLYSDRTDFLANKEFESLKENPLEANAQSWQFAWSTMPTCARVHARINADKLKEQKKKDDINNPVLGPKLVHPFSEPGEVNSWMYKGLNRSDIENGFLSATDSSDVLLDEDKSADESAYERQEECNKSSDASFPIKEPRDWMKELQEKKKCCGPYGRTHWEKKVLDLSSCKNYQVGCAKAFNEYLTGLFLAGCLIMYIECIFYVISMILACFHYAAMKYDETRIAKEYSLLNIREEGVTVIEVNEDENSGKRMSIDHRGLANHDPVQELFHQANLRAERSRRSTAEIYLPSSLNHAGKETRFLGHSASKFESITHALKLTYKGAAARRPSHVSLLPHHSPHNSNLDHKRPDI